MCVAACVGWVTFSSWCYYLSLPLIYLEHLLRKWVLNVREEQLSCLDAGAWCALTLQGVCMTPVYCLYIAMLCVHARVWHFIIASLRAQSPCARSRCDTICNTCYEKDRHLPLIMDLGEMASSSGCLDSPQHVWRHMLLWVNLIDWMAPNSQVQVSSGSHRVNPSKWRMSLGVGRSLNRLAWASSHMPLVSTSLYLTVNAGCSTGHKVILSGFLLIRYVRIKT